MSYNTDLQTNNVNLQAILDTVNNLPEAGSGSGTTVKTCTIDGLQFYPVHYTTVENDTIVYKTVTLGNSSEPITVLCDSIIYYEINESNVGDIELSGGFEVLYYTTNNRHIVIKAPSTANASGTFGIEEVLLPDPW